MKEVAPGSNDETSRKRPLIREGSSFGEVICYPGRAWLTTSLLRFLLGSAVFASRQPKKGDENVDLLPVPVPCPRRTIQRYTVGHGVKRTFSMFTLRPFRI
jgi:hypothetical protein